MVDQKVLRVLIADNHPSWRAGIKPLINRQPDMQVTAQAENGNDLIKLTRLRECDILLLDISISHKSGIDCLYVIRRFHPDLPILMVGDYAESRYAIPMIRSGASGYLCKDARPEDLISAIRTVGQNHRYLPENIANLLADKSAGFPLPKHRGALSKREFQIFIKLASGERPVEIGKDLSISIKTISTYRHRVYAKLQLFTTSDLTRYAITNGLLT